MESEHDSDYSSITLICSETNGTDLDEDAEGSDEITISTDEISSWDLPSILAHKVLKVDANPNRLIEESSYFRGLLSGSFRESELNSISVHWNLESFVTVLRVIFGCDVKISVDNFILLNEAALFFGVDSLLLKCQVWLNEVTSYGGLQSPQLCLDDLINIWKYGLEQGKMEVEYIAADDFVPHLCTSYLARNFMWALSFNSYTDIPHRLLCSSIQHPDLTVDSEKHLCDAILVWLTANAATSADPSNNLCYEIRTHLLPLCFAAGKRRCCFFSKFADKATGDILTLHHSCMTSMDILEEGDMSRFRIRLTKYSQKLDVSSCPQITAVLVLLSVLPPCGADSILRKIIKKSSTNHGNSGCNGQISQALEQILIFESMQELDISNCPFVSLELVVDCLCKSFPSLRTLRAAYFLNFKTNKLCQLAQKFPLLTNIDLSLDISPVIPARVSITASSSVLKREREASSLCYTPRPLLPGIIKLTLEGRTDISDSDLLIISEVCHSLSYVNIKGCTSVTDHGISVMILKCKMLQSVFACNTSFGNNSVLALCSGISDETQQSEEHSQLMDYKILTLHVGGCHGINGNIISELMSGAGRLRSLCLREIELVDDALYRFSGTSLEMLDVSDSKVSSAALSHIVRRNPDLKSLKARGCRDLLLPETEIIERYNSSYAPEELYTDLGKSCKLEEIELGWGFSFFSLGALKPAIRTLRTLVVGLGGSLGHDGLTLLPTICPMLETLILYFQVISDSAIIDIMETLPDLQVLALCYCFGDISSFRFKFRMANLRSLKLERVTPWMTNEDLATLAENCANLVNLSLVGCKLLDAESQAIISSRWPGLTCLRLEECGEITANGVSSLLDCHALEDLVLRHNGPGLSRNFIIYAASKLPMLRKISLDICDAREGDFDIPNFVDRYFLSIVKIARCKVQKSSLEVHNLEARRSPVHKETLVLVWNSEKLERIVVKERL